MTESFDTIRQQAVNLLTRLGNAELTIKEHFDDLNTHGPDNDVAEVHAMHLDGKWHMDVLLTNGDSYDFACDDTRQRHTANA